MIEEIPDNLYTVLTIADIIQETPDFKSFIFSDNHKITYEAGQFLTLVHRSGLEEIRRSYSITSSPALNEPLSIGVKRVANGIFSRKLIDKAQAGDFILTTGASGFFRLPLNLSSFHSIFFFAAGSGIAPVFSLIKTVLHTHPGIQVFLIYSNPSAAATVFYNQLKELESNFEKEFHIQFLFSSLADLRRARLNRELMLEFLTTRQFEKDKTLFYTCGPAAYMRMIIYLLQEQGFPPDNIKKEDFNPRHSAFAKVLPPDTGTHLVTMEVNGHTHEFSVHYPDTILKAAKKEGISLPYSCETGKCGSCVARCLQGVVWLSYNEVLTEKDLVAGLTLTCVGHPVHGDVVLQVGPV